MFVMIKLVSSGLGKGATGIGYSVTEIQFHRQCQPGMVERSWNHTGIGIPVLFLQSMGIGQDTQSVSFLGSLSIKINIFFIGSVRVYYLYCGGTT